MAQSTVTKTGLKTTAVQNPTADNLVVVSRQLKEIAEVGQRLRGDPLDSFVRVRELVNTGLIRVVNGSVVGPVSSSAPGALVPASRKVVGGNSLAGGGDLTADRTITLLNDNASPGNNKVYGTNGSGTKGWFAAAAGLTSPLTTKGDIWVFSSVDTRLPVGADTFVLTADSTKATGLKWAASASGVAVPGAISDLVLWWESDDILGASAAIISRLRERTPWISGVVASNASGSIAVDSTLLNSLPVLVWPAATSGGQYNLQTGFNLSPGATIFVVAKGSTSVGNQTIIGGNTNSLAFYLGLASANVGLVKTGVAVIGTSSTAWVAGTWFQANATYLASSGAYAFRQARAAAGSGTGTTTAGIAATTSFGADNSSNFLNAASLAAVIVYNRVLSGPEIASVENYLFSKWGV